MLRSRLRKIAATVDDLAEGGLIALVVSADNCDLPCGVHKHGRPGVVLVVTPDGQPPDKLPVGVMKAYNVDSPDFLDRI